MIFLSSTLEPVIARRCVGNSSPLKFMEIMTTAGNGTHDYPNCMILIDVDNDNNVNEIISHSHRYEKGGANRSRNSHFYPCPFVLFLTSMKTVR